MNSYLVCADDMTDLSTSRRALFRSLVSIIYREPRVDEHGSVQ